MDAEEYLGKSRLFRRLKNGPHGQLIELYTARVVKDGLARQGMWRCLNLVSGLLSWLSRRRLELTGFDERVLERYLTYRARKQSIQPGDRAALTRLLSVLRDTNVIPPAPLPPIPPEDQIFGKFADYLRDERGLAPKSILRHLPVIRRFLREVCPAGAVDLGKIRQDDVVRYVERHAHDSSVASGKAMCTALRALLRYLFYDGSNPLALAGCVPSFRHWKLANLPTYLSAAQVQKVLDACDRTTGLGRRDHAIVLMLARLGLRASEVAALTLDDIDWRSGTMLIHANGRQEARMPMPPDVGAAIVAYLRCDRPVSSCRRLFIRALAPHVGFASGCAITMIAKMALKRAAISGCAHQGAHLFRHSLATELLRSGATLSQIGQLLRHENHDTTRIYAKVDIAALRTLGLPWPGGLQ
jgi:site-specific recombinase XerD